MSASASAPSRPIASRLRAASNTRVARKYPRASLQRVRRRANLDGVARVDGRLEGRHLQRAVMPGRIVHHLAHQALVAVHGAFEVREVEEGRSPSAGPAPAGRSGCPNRFDHSKGAWDSAGLAR